MKYMQYCAQFIAFCSKEMYVRQPDNTLGDGRARARLIDERQEIVTVAA